MYRIRFNLKVPVSQSAGSYRVRFKVTAPVNAEEPTYRVRFKAILPVAPLRTYRVRFLATCLVNATASTEWYYDKKELMEDVLRSGKGSILNEDLEFIQISNSGIHLHPGFFYYGYKEYYAFPDNRAVHSLGGGSSVSVPKSTIQINQNYPFYVLDDSPTDRFIATNNPADSGEGYRKISDLSQYIDTLDGLTAYSFAQNPKEFTISDTGDNYEFNFYSEDTGTKHLIYVPDPNWQNSTDEHITVEIPDPYKYPELLNKFLCITDDKIIIAPNAISIYYPNKQYRIGDDIPVLITVRGTKGEVAPNYPLTINNTNVTTDSDGMVETTVTAAPGYIHVHTRSGAILPSIYASSCTDASRFVLIERLRDIYGALL